MIKLIKENQILNRFNQRGHNNNKIRGYSKNWLFIIEGLQNKNYIRRLDKLEEDQK